MELFHRGEFWESHEVLEGPWREAGSGFYHGLILLASAWVHVQRENPRGIRAQALKAEAALESFRPHYLGLDVSVLLADARVLREAAEREMAGGGRVETGDSGIPLPRLPLSPARIRGDEPELG